MGSIPPAGTNVFNELPYFRRNIILCRLRLDCRKLRTCRSVELVDARHVRSRKQMPVNISGHLNTSHFRTLPDLITFTRQGLRAFAPAS